MTIRDDLATPSEFKWCHRDKVEPGDAGEGSP